MAKKGKKHGSAPTASSSNHVASSATISAPPATILATPTTISAPVVPLPPSTMISVPLATISVPPATISAPAVPLPPSATISAPPATISVPSAMITAPATRVAFREFIELADLNSIKVFITTAASTPEGENLEHLWDRAFEEGQRALLQTLDRKLDDADNRGYKRGFEEGESSKIKLFAMGLEEGHADEHSEWIAAGHGDHCLTAARIFEDSGTQSEPELISMSVCTQTNIEPTPITAPPPLPSPITISAPPTPSSTPNVNTGTQTNPNPISMSTCTQTDIESTPKPPPPLHIAVQDDVPWTIPLEIQHASSQTLLHSSPIPNPIRTTTSPMSLNWADDAASLPISSLPILTPPILSSHPAPRDLSVLRSSFSKPFSSLQRRNQRSQPRLSQPFRKRQSFNIPHQTSSHYHFPPPRFSTTSVKSARVYPSRTPRFSPSSALNWEGDPRLFELSRALNALGWVRP